MDISRQFVRQKNPCTDGFRWFMRHFQEGADYQPLLDALVAAGRVSDACWLMDQFGPTKAVLEDVRSACWSELTSHLLSNVTGQAAPVFDAQGELVCVMTTVADLGQLKSPEDRRALFHAANRVNQSTGGLPWQGGE